MYQDLARYYDRIYSWKDYAAEARRTSELLDGLGIAPGSRVLDAGCGTGSHLALLRDRYAVAGFDGAEGMLDVARAKLADVPLFRADLDDFTVEKPYDAVLCLFSGIGYLQSEARLRAAARCLAAAIRPGGVLLLETWFEAKNWNVGRPSLQTWQDDDVKLARACVAEQEGDLAVFEFHWLIAERGRPVRHVRDRHALWLCPHELLRAIFTESGFEVRYDENGLGTGRALLTGIRI